MRRIVVLTATLLLAVVLAAPASAHPLDVTPPGTGETTTRGVGGAGEGHFTGIPVACERTRANPAVVDFEFHNGVPGDRCLHPDVRGAQ